MLKFFFAKSANNVEIVMLNRNVAIGRIACHKLLLDNASFEFFFGMRLLLMGSGSEAILLLPLLLKPNATHLPIKVPIPKYLPPIMIVFDIITSGVQ